MIFVESIFTVYTLNEIETKVAMEKDAENFNKKQKKILDTKNQQKIQTSFSS